MMARLGLTLNLHVPDGWTKMMESLSEVFCNAHYDGPAIEMRSERGGIFHGSFVIMQFGATRTESGRAIIPITPGLGLPGFAVSVLSILPDRAAVEWVGAWPVFKCPPNDDRDDEDDPSPLVPDELCLA